MKPQTLIFITILNVSLISCEQKYNNPKTPTIYASAKVTNLYSDVYGPFTRDSGNVSFTAKYNTSEDTTFESIKIREKNSQYFFFSKNASSHTYDPSTNTVTFTVIIPMDEVLTDKGIYIYVYIKDKSTKDILSQFNFPLSQTYSRNINTSVTNFITIYDSLFSIPTRTSWVEESFYFFNTLPSFLNEDYYKLPLDGIYFLYYHNGHPFTYSEVYLTYDDPYNLFLNCKKDNEVHIPLDIYRKGNNNEFCYFKYKNTMFVDKNSLSMSLTSLYNYIETKDFYMPRGQGTKLDESSWRIVAKEVGVNKTNITIPLTFYSARNHFGNCDDSDYCVTGEIVE